MRTAASIALVLALVTPAAAQQDYFTDPNRQPLTYRIEGERTTSETIVVASLAGGALLFGGIGALFMLRYQDAAADVEAFAGDPTMRVYTEEVDARRQDAERDSWLAGVSYGVGGALVIATVVAYIVTHPEDEIHEYGSTDDSRVSQPFVVPVEGGAVAGAAWRW